MITLSRRQISVIGALLILGFILLFLMESYFQQQGSKPESFSASLPAELTYSKFPNILSYLENVEEATLEKDDQAGCFDNDRLLESIKGPGQTCKSWAPKVKDIYYKKEPGKLVPKNMEDDYFPSGEGREYNFAELCPVTTNQDLPLNCLYKKSSKFNELSSKVAGIIDKTQTASGVMLDNLDDSISYHIVDTNRLYNTQHVRDFLLYERQQNMNRGIRNSSEDYIDDLGLYAAKFKNK